MRHGKKFNHLGRKSAHRKAMLASMASSLVEHKRINTTLAKAKALRTFIEPLITKSKSDTTHNRRIVFRYLRNKYAVTELFRDIAVKVADRPGGYTRVIKLGNRLGDNADMAMIELVDYNESYTSAKPAQKKSRRRRRKGGKGEDTATDEQTQNIAETEAQQLEKNEAEVKDAKAGDKEKQAKAETKKEGPKAEAQSVEEVIEEEPKESEKDVETKGKTKTEEKKDDDTQDGVAKDSDSKKEDKK